jgi:hypothetical protein
MEYYYLFFCKSAAGGILAFSVIWLAAAAAEFYDIWPRSGILYVMAEAKQKFFVCLF